ncbi:MAG: hypothetical protein H7281_01060 [Bacteriovorax sp.]|nr:hypothetical protein [Bacteriovorax sp.]
MVEQYLKRSKSLSILVFVVILFCGLTFAYALNRGAYINTSSIVISFITLIWAYIVSSTFKIMNQWEKVIVLRLGKFYSLWRSFQNLFG